MEVHPLTSNSWLINPVKLTSCDEYELFRHFCQAVSHLERIRGFKHLKGPHPPWQKLRSFLQRRGVDPYVVSWLIRVRGASVGATY